MRRGEDAAWPVACSLCLRLYCCSTRCRAACTTPRGISRQNAKNVFTTKATQAAGSRQRDATAAPLLIAGALNGSAAL